MQQNAAITARLKEDPLSLGVLIMGLFFRQKAPTRRRADTPPKFQWVAVRMELTTWLITGTLSVAALGIWNGAYKIGELAHTVSELVESDARQAATNKAQDGQIRAIEMILSKHQGYLERILEAVRENGRKLR